MILLAGGIGASVMITLTGLFTNICLVYGIGSVPTIAKRKKIQLLVGIKRNMLHQVQKDMEHLHQLT